jgi:hypothetical protein
VLAHVGPTGSPVLHCLRLTRPAVFFVVRLAVCERMKGNESNPSRERGVILCRDSGDRMPDVLKDLLPPLRSCMLVKRSANTFL